MWFTSPLLLLVKLDSHCCSLNPNSNLKIHIFGGGSHYCRHQKKIGLDCRGVVWYVWYYKDLSLCDVFPGSPADGEVNELMFRALTKAFFGTGETSRSLLVGGFKHVLSSISYMGCHPSHWRTHIFQRGLQPPTSLCCIPSYYPMSPRLRAPLIKSFCLWKIHCKTKMNHLWSSLSIINHH